MENIFNIQLPIDLHDLDDVKLYFESIKHFQKLENQIENFIKKLVDTHFLKTGKEIINFLTSSDLKKFLINSNIVYVENEDLVLTEFIENYVNKNINDTFLLDMYNQKIIFFNHVNNSAKHVLNFRSKHVEYKFYNGDINKILFKTTIITKNFTTVKCFLLDMENFSVKKI